MTARIIVGDCLDVLRSLPSESVHCCVTSPPYWGLRDYGVAGQLGLEPTIGAYVEKMVAVFREVRRVLRDDGTLWLNLGDSYNTQAGAVGSRPGGGGQGDKWLDKGAMTSPNRLPQDGFKPKDLCGIPWRVAFALQADGWWLRQDIIWAKPNPMPESVTDRCTKSHEYIFLLTKSERYHCDMAAIAEPCTQDEMANGFRGGAYCNNETFLNEEGGRRTNRGNYKTPDGWDTTKGAGGHGSFHKDGREAGHVGYVSKSGNKERKPASARGVPVDTHGSSNGAAAGSVPWEGTMRNKRSVWTVATSPFKEAHFATFPPALIEPCIAAGCPSDGVVLDPFGGAGTTALVADRLQRDSILIELNPEYAAMARRRVHNDAPLFANVHEATA